MFLSRRNPTKLQEPARIVIENLEGRCMLSASSVAVTIDRHGLLDVTGTRRSDTIAVVMDHRHKSVLDVIFNGQVFGFKASAVKKILVNAGAGNDKVSVDSTVTDSATLLGGAGDDTITAGGGEDAIDGGTGNDQCNFDHHDGIPFAQAPTAVQAGLTTLAQGATVDRVQVFHDDGQTYYGAVVSINTVLTRIVVDASGNPVSTGDNGQHNGDHHQDDGRRFGMIFAIDTNANTITVNIASEHGRGRQLTLNVDSSAVITADGTATTLGGLTAGAWVNLQLSPGDSTTVTVIQEFGRRIIAPITGIDPNANTVTVPSEHGADRTFNVDPNATVTLDGTASTFASLSTGMIAQFKFSADNSVIVAIDAISAPSGDGGHHDDADHLGHDL